MTMTTRTEATSVTTSTTSKKETRMPTLETLTTGSKNLTHNLPRAQYLPLRHGHHQYPSYV